MIGPRLQPAKRWWLGQVGKGDRPKSLPWQAPTTILTTLISPKTRKGPAFTVNDQGSAKVGADPEGLEAVLALVPKPLGRYLVRPLGVETLKKI